MATPSRAASDLPPSHRPGREAAGEHILPVKTYLAVYGALVLLTGVTVGVSLADLGTMAIYVAMAIAMVKAGAVVSYFMHLKFDARFHAFIFLSSLLFLGIFFVLTMIDLGSRGAVIEDQGNFVLRNERAAAAAARRAAGAALPAGAPVAPSVKGKP